jgi:hypothetical protein
MLDQNNVRITDQAPAAWREEERLCNVGGCGHWHLRFEHLCQCFSAVRRPMYRDTAYCNCHLRLVRRQHFGSGLLQAQKPEENVYEEPQTPELSGILDGSVRQAVVHTHISQPFQGLARMSARSRRPPSSRAFSLDQYLHHIIHHPSHETFHLRTQQRNVSARSSRPPSSRARIAGSGQHNFPSLSCGPTGSPRDPEPTNRRHISRTHRRRHPVEV